MKKMILLIGTMILILGACSSSSSNSNKDIIEKQVKMIKSFEEISPYLDGDISYEVTIPAADFNNYTTILSLNTIASDAFSYVKNNEKINIMNKMRESISTNDDMYSGEFTCGENRCQFDLFTIIDGTDEYSFKINEPQFVYLNNSILFEEKTGFELQEEELRQSIQSKLNSLAEHLYMLKRYGYDYSFKIESNNTNGYEAEYSFSFVQGMGHSLALEIQKTNSTELIEVAQRLEDNTTMIHDLIFEGPFEGGANPDTIKEVMKDIVSDMQIIGNSYPSSYVDELAASL
ncbi:hypothetical protein V6B14_12820 [Sporosarcina psychrophila]|uniref:hypothetical protein n=1 Tax=Sporosarcina psychrophila TaxID=1476 RepID=UPI0030CC0987